MLRSFARSEAGAITLLWLILIPAFLLVGGFATDIALINAQKRYVQAQADLAAQSAVRSLPDLAEARSIAQQVVTLNGKYGDVTLGQGDVLFGHFDTAGNQFVAAADQTDPAGVNAVRVSVPSGYDPFLLGPVMTRDDYVIQRSAVAAQRAAIAFTLRNRLLGVDTSQSVLDPLLSNLLGLGASVQVLGYQGLANASVGINELLGLLSARVGVQAVTFEDILNVPISLDTLIGGLKDLDALPAGVSSSSGDTLSLGSILAISPEALQARIGRILPDLKLNVFDLLMAAVSLNGSGANNPLGTASVVIPLPGLVDVKLGLALIHPAVIAAGFIDDVPPVQAELSQLEVALNTELLSILKLGLNVEGAAATATALTLDCGAMQGADTLATFNVKTETLRLTLTASLLSLIHGKTIEDSTPLSILGNEQVVSVRKDQLGVPVPITNEIHLSTVTSALGGLLEQLRDSTIAEKPASCGLLGLGCLLGSLLRSVFDLVTSVVNVLDSILANLGILDALIQGLLDLLGIQLAQADLILNDYSCSGALVQ